MIGKVVKHLINNEGSALVIEWEVGGWDNGFVPLPNLEDVIKYPVGSKVTVEVYRDL